MAFHDYQAAMRGVVLAVDYFLDRNPNYKRIDLADSLLFVEKVGKDSAVAARAEHGATRYAAPRASSLCFCALFDMGIFSRLGAPQSGRSVLGACFPYLCVFERCAALLCGAVCVRRYRRARASFPYHPAAQVRGTHKVGRGGGCA